MSFRHTGIGILFERHVVRGGRTDQMGGPPSAHGGYRFPGGTTEEAVRQERVAFRRRLCLLVPVPPVRPVVGQSVHLGDLRPDDRGCRVRHVQDPSLPSQGRPATEDQESTFRTDIPWRGDQLNGPEGRPDQASGKMTTLPFTWRWISRFIAAAASLRGTRSLMDGFTLPAANHSINCFTLRRCPSGSCLTDSPQ